MTRKNPTLAELGLDLAAIRKYKIDVRTGVVETDGTTADHERAMAAIDRIGALPADMRGARPSTPQELAEFARAMASADARAAVVPPVPSMPSRTLAAVAESWISERRQKNKPRTIYAKVCHYGNFIEWLASTVDLQAFNQAELAAFKQREQNAARERAEAEGKQFRKLDDSELTGMFVAMKTPVESLSKQHAVDFKKAMLAAGQKAKTVDNKLLTLSDFFAYAIGNGDFDPPKGANPVSKTYILTKKERQEQADRYKPFTPADLGKMFDPVAYKAAMGAEPDLYWCPLIALFSGMRISEATGIHCDDVSKSPNGVDIIFVRKSKTGAGIRDVPIAQALIDLGFLDFVAIQKAAGHERLFPDRLLINDSYSKELSDAFRDYLIAVGVRKFADKSERKSFHSFRANVITQFRVRGVPIEKSMRIVGHSTGMSSSMQTHLGYVHELPDLKDVVDLLVWPIDLVGLKK